MQGELSFWIWEIFIQPLLKKQNILALIILIQDLCLNS